jgi:hypothetical protein
MSEVVNSLRSSDDRLIESQRPTDSTTVGVRASERHWSAAWMRRAATAVLVAIVAAAGAGMLGVRTSTATSVADGYSLSVTYAAVARAGLDVPFRIQVDAADGFSEDITLAIDAGYFGLFETQGFLPEPAESVSVGDVVRLTFDPPPQGLTFVVNYDAYIQPSSQRGASARVELIIDDEPTATVDITTTLLP